MDPKPERNAAPKVINGRINGRFAPGFSGNPGGDAGRARRELNRLTIEEMTNAFRRGGVQAINKVMKNNPAMFLKMLVLLVPREMKFEHSGGVKAMSDEELERTLEVIKELIAQRDAAANAKVIEGTVEKPKGVLSRRELALAMRTREPAATVQKKNVEGAD